MILTAKTAPVENASTKILKKNGFVYREIVQDHEIGNAWLWELRLTDPNLINKGSVLHEDALIEIILRCGGNRTLNRVLINVERKSRGQKKRFHK